MGILNFLFKPKVEKPDVEKMERDRDVKGLIKALDYGDDYKLQEKALKAIIKIGEPSVKPLILALKDESVAERKKAIEALKKIKWMPKEKIEQAWYFLARAEFDELVKLGEIAVDPFLLTLKDRDFSNRAIAAKCLGEIGMAKAIDPLILALKDEKLEVGEKAAEALGKIGNAKAIDPLMLVLMKDERPSIQKEAAKALGNIGRLAIEPLLTALKDPDWGIRTYAIGALGRIGTDSVIDALAQALLKDEHGDVRKEAAEALGETRDRRVLKFLIPALKDREIFVRAKVAEALGKIGDPKAGELLMEILNEQKVSEKIPKVFVKAKAAEALGRIGDVRAIDLLVKALKEVPEEASEALVNIGIPSIRALTQALKDKDPRFREKVTEVLEKIKGKKEKQSITQ